MLIYALLILFVATAALVVGKRKKLASWFIAGIFTALWVIASFRSFNIGVDTPAYAHYFNEVSNGNIDVLGQIGSTGLFGVEGFENGYKFYNFVMSLVTDNFTVLMAVAYAFIFFSFYKFIKKYSTNFLLSVLVYIPLFFFGSMNHFRQAIAMAILTWGFGYIHERKLLKYVAVVALATLVHQASIVMIVPYFLYGRKVNKKSIFIYGSVAVALFVLVDPIINLLASDNMRYETYIEKINSFQVGSYIIAAVYGGLLLFVLWLKSQAIETKIKLRDMKIENFYLHMLIIAVLVAIVSIKVSALSRFISYFMIFAIISLPYFISINQNTKMIKSLTLLLVISLYIYSFGTMILRPEWLGVWPYEGII